MSAFRASAWLPSVRWLLMAACVLGLAANANGEETARGWRETNSFAAPEARQAAAVDQRFVYAIASDVVAKYDRASGHLLARSQGAATHLNSGFLADDKLYLAHSNYPARPEHSEIKVLDPATMRLSTWHDFDASEGSLTWCVRVGDAWWCNFAYYGDENAKSYVAKFIDWQEVARWTYPPQVLVAFGQKSSSGGIWRDGRLLVTGHDEREIHVLELPAEGHVLTFIATVAAPFTGQGIAADPPTGGLVGIDRAKRRVVLAMLDNERPAPTWKACLAQPAAWYATREAVRIADQVLLYQRACGGWQKNVDMAAPLDEAAQARLRATRSESGTIDNGATHTQIRFLAREATATDEPRFREGTLAGIDYLLAAQYPSGGWPQVFPNPTGYRQHITFNDNAMTGALEVLRDVALGKRDFEFVDEARRTQAAAAVRRGIECILKCQIVVDGRPTVWCAQHDRDTFAPATARSYELPSFSGAESVGVVRFLMQIDEPSPAVIVSIEGAVDWFERARLNGIRTEIRQDASLPRGWDKVVVEDPQAPPLWARFYDLKTNRPFFCSRDGVPREHLAEIDYERRTGYAWYVTSPADLLARDYARWKQRWRSQP